MNTQFLRMLSIVGVIALSCYAALCAAFALMAVL